MLWDGCSFIQGHSQSLIAQHPPPDSPETDNLQLKMDHCSPDVG
jgi:hypothetical protein